MSPETQDRIDVHHHIYPPAFTSALARHGRSPSGWFLPPWTLSANHQICSSMGIRTAILPCTAPGPDIEPDPKATKALARACNDFTASFCDSESSKYGFFASVPSLLHTAAAIAEMRHALDDRHADEIVLMKRYGAVNRYLGAAAFTQIWNFLCARHAVVFIHPAHPTDNT